MCSEKNLIQGRSSIVVAAVSLYIACRADGTAPYLLIDFSDAIQTNMYTLGQVYMHLVHKLFLNKRIPLIDPCLFIRRFCDRLDFGKQTEHVVKLATRFL